VADRLATSLRDALFENFNEEELTALAQATGLDYAQLPGEGAFGKTRELVRAAAARDRLRLLAACAREMKPQLAETLTAQPGEGAVSAAEGSVPEAAPVVRDGRQWRDLRSLLGVAALLFLAVLCVWLVASNALKLFAEARGGMPTPLPAATARVEAAIPPVAPPNAPTRTPSAGAAATPIPTSTRADLPVVTLAPPAGVASPTVPPPRATATAAPLITGTVVPTDAIGGDPVQTVRDLNAQLIEFYVGRTDEAALARFWKAGPRQSVLDFAESPLLRLLGLTSATRATALSVTMRYVQAPTVSRRAADSAVVVSREYWRYANTRTGKAVCETRDYTYTLIVDQGRYVVESFDGALIDTKCVE